jgi:hypothetical protein
LAPLQVVAGAKTYYKATATACGTGCRYIWIADDGRGSVLSDTQTPTGIYLVFSPGRHTVQVVATASNGLTSKTQITVVASAVAVVAPSPKPTVKPTAPAVPYATTTEGDSTGSALSDTPALISPTSTPVVSPTPDTNPSEAAATCPVAPSFLLPFLLGLLAGLGLFALLLIALLRRRREDDEDDEAQ